MKNSTYALNSLKLHTDYDCLRLEDRTPLRSTLLSLWRSGFLVDRFRRSGVRPGPWSDSKATRISYSVHCALTFSLLIRYQRIPENLLWSATAGSG